MRWATMAAVWVMACGLAAGAADAPATRPEMATAKGALKYMDKATLEGGVATALSFFYSTNDQEHSVAEAFAQSETDVMELVKLARDRFGEDVGDDVMHAVGGQTDIDTDVSIETDDGDKAVIKWKDGSDPTPMIRVGGEWKVDIAKVIADLQGNTTPQDVVNDAKAACDAIKRVTADMKAGKFGDGAALTKAAKAAMDNVQDGK